MVKNFISYVCAPSLIAIFIFFPLFFILGQNCFAQGKVYNLIYDFAYNAGYEGGKEEKEEGYKFEPEVVLAQPVFQLVIKNLKQKINISTTQEPEFDQGFRDGFNAGYKDGYYGYSKKNN